MIYLTFTLEILIMVGLPVSLWLIVRRWPGVTWGLIVAGMVTFVGSQTVHLPLNWALGLLGGGRGAALWPAPLVAAVAGLSAGVCEEGARYLVLRFWRREDRSWSQGVAFGLGHGGAESILIGVVAVSTFIQMIALRQMDLQTLGLGPDMLEQLQTQVEAFWSMPWGMPLLGGVERVFALTMQVAFSLLVVRSLRRNNVGWLAVAVLAHAVVDGVAVGLAQAGWPALGIEGVVLLFAIGAGGIILVLRRADTFAAPEGDDVSRETSA